MEARWTLCFKQVDPPPPDHNQHHHQTRRAYQKKINEVISCMAPCLCPPVCTATVSKPLIYAGLC